MQTVSSRLGAAIPDDWHWKESLTFLAPEGDANVIFSSEPLAPDVDIERYSEAQGALLRSEFTDYRELAFEQMLMMGGRWGFLRRFEWTPPDGDPVTQVQLYYVEDSRGYTATATTSTARFADIESAMIQILDSLTIAGPPAPRATAAQAAS